MGEKILKNGTLYIDGEPFGSIEDFEFEKVIDAPEWPDSTKYLSLDSESEFTATITGGALLRAIIGNCLEVINSREYRRVAYLAAHAKKWRTRKKNFHRLLGIIT